MATFRLKNYDEDSPWPSNSYTGEWVIEWPNGAKKFHGHFVDGKEDGVSLTYFENGNLAQKGRWCSGERVGRLTDFHVDGFITAERDFTDGEIQGVERHYWSNGSLMYEHTYKDGVLHGPSRAFSRGGTLLHEGVYREGDPWSGVCEVTTFEKQADGGYTFLAEYENGAKIRDIERPADDEQ